jgi:hypothetical protein
MADDSRHPVDRTVRSDDRHCADDGIGHHASIQCTGDDRPGDDRTGDDRTGDDRSALCLTSAGNSVHARRDHHRDTGPSGFGKRERDDPNPAKADSAVRRTTRRLLSSARATHERAAEHRSGKIVDGGL